MRSPIVRFEVVIVNSESTLQRYTEHNPRVMVLRLKPPGRLRARAMPKGRFSLSAMQRLSFPLTEFFYE